MTTPPDYIFGGCQGHRIQSNTGSATTPIWCTQCGVWVDDPGRMAVVFSTPDEGHADLRARVEAITVERNALKAQLDKLAALYTQCELALHAALPEGTPAPHFIDAVNAVVQEVRTLRAERAAVHAVADPDGAFPELTLREIVMRLGEQAALLVSVTRWCEEHSQGRVAALTQVAQLQTQFELQRANYLKLFAAVFGGTMPDFEVDPFAEALRNHAAQRDVVQMRTQLSRINEWADTYGADLKPTGADTYGEGVRVCKRRIKAMLGDCGSNSKKEP